MYMSRFLASVNPENISQDEAQTMYTLLQRIEHDVMYAPVVRGERGEGQLDVKQQLDRIGREELPSFVRESDD